MVHKFIFNFFAELNELFSSERPASRTETSAFYSPSTSSRTHHNDPFDTSYVNTDRLYSNSTAANYSAYNHSVESASVPASANNAGASNGYVYQNFDSSSSPAKKLDSRFLAELEKTLGVQEANANTSIPTLKPPPADDKSLLKKQPNFMSHQAPPKLNARINSWSSKSTNLQAEKQRPASMYLPGSFSVVNEPVSPMSSRSAKNFDLSPLRTYYANDLSDSEAMLNQMRLTTKESVPESNENNLFRNAGSKCEKLPLHTEFVSMMTNVYDSTPSVYQYGSEFDRNYVDTPYIHNDLSGNEAAASSLHNSEGVPGVQNVYWNLEVPKTAANVPIAANTSYYRANGANYQQNSFNTRYATYDGRLTYGNSSNVYDAVPEEDVYDERRPVTNIYDAVADEYN